VSVATNPAILPSPEQRALLRAAVLPRSDALRAWTAWRRGGGDIDDLDATTQAVLPELCRQLLSFGVRDRDIGRLKGAYRRCWYENLHVMRVVRPALQILEEAGIPTMLCKGAALIVGYGRDPGARPMGDVDVVVPPDRARRALETLIGSGYWPTGGIEPFGALRVRRALNLAGPGSAGGRLDLHWSTLPGPEPGSGVFDRACGATLLGAPTTVPSPADALLSVLAHGTSFDAEPVRWVLDGAFCLRTFGDAVDWDRFVVRARFNRFGPALAVALGALRSDYGSAVPDGVIAALEGAPTSLLDRALWTLQCHPLPRGQRWPSLFNAWHRARRDMPAEGSVASSTLSLPGPRPGISGTSSDESGDTRPPGSEYGAVPEQSGAGKCRAGKCEPGGAGSTLGG
jgi:Uncharacterised nucleotidyltransferase